MGRRIARHFWNSWWLVVTEERMYSAKAAKVAVLASNLSEPHVLGGDFALLLDGK